MENLKELNDLISKKQHNIDCLKAVQKIGLCGGSFGNAYIGLSVEQTRHNMNTVKQIIGEENLNGLIDKLKREISDELAKHITELELEMSNYQIIKKQL